MTLDELDKLIREARSPRDLFGDDVDATLLRLMVVCHPDKNPGEPRAERLFKQLQDLAAEARRPPVTVPSPKRQYTLLKLLAAGDLSDVHLATAGGHDYVLKVSRIEGGAALLGKEGRALAAILTEAGDTHYAKYFPTLAESFAARDRIEKRVNVFTHRPGLYTLEQVRHRYETGLDGRHLAWIFKRLLTAVGFAHRVGWVHGAILPPHVLLQPEEHGVQLVGWPHATPAGGQVRTISTRHRYWYPTEVLQKDPVGPPTDIYLAAKCVVYLAGGEPGTATIPAGVPEPMQRFLRACLLEGRRMRPDDAWKLLDEFDEMLRGLYGPPTFHHLTMP